LKYYIASYKNIWKISYPIILGLLAQNLINVIDTAFLGRVGEVELGASAIAGLFYFSLFTLGFGFGIGTQILIGRRNGERNYKDIGILVDHGFYFLIILGISIFFLIEFLSPVFLKQFIKSDAIYKASIIYLDYRMWGIVFAFINVIFRAFYVGIVKTKVLTYSAVIMAIMNISLDYLLIFGNYGFPEMGIGGAAIASVIAEGTSVLFFIVYTLVRIDIKKYRLFIFPKLNVRIIIKTLEISVFIMLQYFISMAGWFAFFMIIEKSGERPLAISNIIRSVYLILMIPIWGFSSATNTLVSNTIGKGLVHKVIPVIKKVINLSFLSTFLVIILTVTFPRLLISIYTTNIELINETIPVLYVITGALVLFSISVILFNGVSGTANTNIALLIEFITIVIYMTYTYLIAVIFKQSIEVIWCAEYVYFILLGGMSYLYLKNGNWSKKVV